MLKKVIFAAVLSLGFIASFKVGAAVDAPVQGAKSCPTWPDCQQKCPLNYCD